MRTPITALRSFNELLLGVAAEDNGTRHEFLQEGQLQIKRLERITDSLLNLSRLEGGLIDLKLEAYSAADLISNVANNYKVIAQEREITLLLELPSEAILLHCDPQQLECALGNLVDNALKFTPAGGKVQIGAALHESTKGNDTSEVQKANLWVKDNGIGIAPDEIPLIFDRFHRGRNATQGGSGLGLAIAKRIVEMHGGTIEVSSALQSGSQFVIVLQPSHGFTSIHIRPSSCNQHRMSIPQRRLTKK